MSEERLQAIVFDMDGVLVETETIHMQGWRRFAENHGIEIDQEYFNALVGISVDDNMVNVKRDFNLAEPAAQLVAEKSRLYLDYARELQPGPMDGFAGVVNEARKRGAKVAVATSSPRDQLDVVVASALRAIRFDGGPEDFFDAVVTGDDAPRTKPAPDIYLETVRRLGVEPGRSVAFEDSPAGVEAAAAAGLVAVAVPTCYTAHMDFPGATAVVASLGEALERGLLDACERAGGDER